MDKLYIGDIPLDYHYVMFSDNHLDLYNRSVLPRNSSVTYYRIYTNYDNFMYSVNTVTTPNYDQVISNSIEVTNDVMYRNDMPQIVSTTFIFAIGFVFLINLVTSFVKRGGLLHGLL